MTVAGWVNINIMLLLNIVEVNVVTTSGFYVINFYQNVKFIRFLYILLTHSLLIIVRITEWDRRGQLAQL